MLWYHGDTSPRVDFTSQRWDRERFTSAQNENGPGLYFTSSIADAKTYGPHLYTAEMRPGFRLCSTSKRPALVLLQGLAKQAEQDDREVFVSNFGSEWSPTAEKRALENYAHQDAYGALLTLYHDLFRYDAARWVAAMRAVGFDGVIVERHGGVQHLVVWDPQKLKIERVS